MRTCRSILNNLIANGPVILSDFPVCIAVNDPNVMKAWGENQSAGAKIFMVGDPFLKFTKAIGAEVDKSEKGLGIRSNRYTMLVENGEVKKVEEEKETASCELSSAESFLKSI